MPAFWPYHHLNRGAMKWTAEHEVMWLINGQRVSGRIAIGVPELVADGDGEAICPVAIDGLQPITSVHGEGEFHALMQAVRFLDMRLRHFVAGGVRVVFDDDPEASDGDPEEATEGLLAMFRPFS
jgi:hypothetical protein